MEKGRDEKKRDERGSAEIPGWAVMIRLGLPWTLLTGTGDTVRIALAWVAQCKCPFLPLSVVDS